MENSSSISEREGKLVKPACARRVAYQTFHMVESQRTQSIPRGFEERTLQGPRYSADRAWRRGTAKG